jgi:hypothetical protein
MASVHIIDTITSLVPVVVTAAPVAVGVDVKLVVVLFTTSSTAGDTPEYSSMPTALLPKLLTPLNVTVIVVGAAVADKQYHISVSSLGLFCVLDAKVAAVYVLGEPALSVILDTEIFAPEALPYTTHTAIKLPTVIA